MNHEIRYLDMSLSERVGVLERRLEKSENKRKIMMSLVLEMMDRQHMRLTDTGKDALLELEA